MSNDNLPISDSKLSTGEDVQAHVVSDIQSQGADAPFRSYLDAEGADTSHDVQAHVADGQDGDTAGEEGKPFQQW